MLGVYILLGLLGCVVAILIGLLTAFFWLHYHGKNTEDSTTVVILGCLVMLIVGICLGVKVVAVVNEQIEHERKNPSSSTGRVG